MAPPEEPEPKPDEEQENAFASPISDNLYDHPELYDMVFAWGPEQEADFYSAVFERFYEGGKVKSIFEPGCGTGRLVVALAGKGYKVQGLDKMEPMVEFARLKAQEAGVKGRTRFHVGDMTEMKLKTRFDCAYNAISTFRYLLTEEDILAHLMSMARILKPGGIYAIDLELLGNPDRFVEGDQDEWEIEHPDKGVKVRNVFAYITPLNFERMQVLAEAHIWFESPEEEYEFYQWEAMRIWPLEDLQAMIRAQGDFEIIKWYKPQGVWDVDQEFKPDPDEPTRVVVVLRKL